MKKYLFLITLLSIGIAGFSQADTIPPYKKFPTYPPVSLLLPDSSSHFTKNDVTSKSSIMLMVFNPTCEHCQHETEEIIKHMDDFKNFQIIMATTMPYDSMMSFRKKYNLTQYKNIVVGQDTHYFLPTFYSMSYMPFLAFYNKKKELISVFQGTMPIDKALEELKK